LRCRPPVLVTIRIQTCDRGQAHVRGLAKRQAGALVIGQDAYFNTRIEQLAALALRDQLRSFHEGLAQSGCADGRNVAIEYRWAEGHYDRLPVLAAELVRRRVSVIVAPGGAPCSARVL
jgi:hypothetical protein